MSQLPRYNHKHSRIKHNYSNTMLSKSISSKAIFEGVTFFNVNFRGVRLRKSRFFNCSFILCDFYGAIYNKGKFENAFFKKCVFYASIFRNCRFEKCTFESCVFINMKNEFEKGNNLRNCDKYSYYDLSIPKEVQEELQIYRKLEVFQKNRLLYIKGGKLNKSTLFIALKYFSYSDFKRRLNLACEHESIEKTFTTFRLIELLQKQNH